MIAGIANAANLDDNLTELSNLLSQVITFVNSFIALAVFCSIRLLNTQNHN